MDKFFEYIEKIKSKKRGILVIFLELSYHIFRNTVIVGLINVIIPILVTIIRTDQRMTVPIILIVGLVLVNGFHAVALSYHSRVLMTVEGNARITQFTQSLVKLLNERIAERKEDSIFIDLGDQVCSDLYYFFQDIFNIETRISIVHQYADSNNPKNYLSSIVCRKSKSTQKLGRRKHEKRVRFNSNWKEKPDYYYNKILLDNDKQIVVLFKGEIEKLFKRNKAGAKINQYICIPQFVLDDRIAYLIQIDIMHDAVLATNRDDVIKICHLYLEPIERIMQTAYLIEKAENLVKLRR